VPPRLLDPMVLATWSRRISPRLVSWLNVSSYRDRGETGSLMIVILDLAAGYAMSDLLIERAIEMDRTSIQYPHYLILTMSISRKARYLCSIHAVH
jgi:hypothetical protein